MIDIDIVFEPKDGKKELDLMFTGLTEGLRKNIYFLAHMFSLLGAQTIIFDIRAKDGKESAVCIPRIPNNGKFHSQRIVGSMLASANHLLKRPHTRPVYIVNECSTPISYEIFE